MFSSGCCVYGFKPRHTDCTRAPFFPPPTTATVEPSLRSVLDFCRLTTICDDELKLSEACLLTAGIMIGDWGRRELEEGAKLEMELVVAFVCSQ